MFGLFFWQNLKTFRGILWCFPHVPLAVTPTYISQMLVILRGFVLDFFYCYYSFVHLFIYYCHPFFHLQYFILFLCFLRSFPFASGSLKL